MKLVQALVCFVTYISDVHTHVMLRLYNSNSTAVNNFFDYYIECIQSVVL